METTGAARTLAEDVRALGDLLGETLAAHGGEGLLADVEEMRLAAKSAREAGDEATREAARAELAEVAARLDASQGRRGGARLRPLLPAGQPRRGRGAHPGRCAQREAEGPEAVDESLAACVAELHARGATRRRGPRRPRRPPPALRVHRPPHRGQAAHHRAAPGAGAPGPGGPRPAAADPLGGPRRRAGASGRRWRPCGSTPTSATAPRRSSTRCAPASGTSKPSSSTPSRISSGASPPPSPGATARWTRPASRSRWASARGWAATGTETPSSTRTPPRRPCASTGAWSSGATSTTWRRSPIPSPPLRPGSRRPGRSTPPSTATAAPSATPPPPSGPGTPPSPCAGSSPSCARAWTGRAPSPPGPTRGPRPSSPTSTRCGPPCAGPGRKALPDDALLDLILRVRGFGFALVALDLREDARVHRRVVAELLGEAGYLEWDDARRREALAGPAPPRRSRRPHRRGPPAPRPLRAASPTSRPATVRRR